MLLTWTQCGEVGHIARNCPRSGGAGYGGGGYGGGGSGFGGGAAGKTCYSCGGYGHMSRTCPRLELDTHGNQLTTLHRRVRQRYEVLQLRRVRPLLA